MASYGEGMIKPPSPHEVASSERRSGVPRHIVLRTADLPGWSFAVRGGRVAFVSAALATWLGYETTSPLQGAAVSALVVGALVARDEGRRLVTLLKREGTAAHVEMASVSVELDGGEGQLFWAPGQGAELPSKARRSNPLTSLAAGLAHELNNPLTYLTLNLGFLERELGTLAGEPGADEARAGVARATEVLGVAREGVERLSTIVRDLRAFSRTSDGVRPVDARRLLEMSLALTRNHLRHKVRLRLDLADVADVDANEALLGQALVTLLMATVQGVPDGEANEHCLDLRLSQPSDDEVELVMTLQGPKTPALDGEADVLRSRELLSSFRAVLQVEPASVKLRMWVSEGPPESHPLSTLPPSSTRTERPRVLLVEDDAQVADALRTLLHDEAEIEQVSSGRQAIEVLLRDQGFHLVLCDLMMPDMGGVDVHEAIRRARPGVERRIVFLTGGAFTQRTRDFLRTMPNRTLDKPIDPTLLLALVRASRSSSG